MCPTITVSLTSSCERPVSGATFSGLGVTELLPSAPGTYSVSVCDPPGPVTITLSGHVPVDVSGETFADDFSQVLVCSGR